MNYFIITDKNGDFLMFKHYDGESVSSTPTAADIKNIKREARLFVHRYSNDTVNGILTLSTGPAIFAASNVLNSDLTEESAGSLIMIKNIDGAYMDEISARTKLNTSIILYDDFDVESWSNPIMLDNAITGDAIVAPNLDQDIEKYPFKIIDNHYSMSYTIVDDITGIHSFVVTILSEREVYSQAKMVMSIYLATSIIVCLFLYLLLFLLLNRTLLSRISNINNDIKRVYEKKDLKERIVVEGTDELSELTDSFNKILAGLESADYERNVIFDANPDTLLMADSEGKLVAKKISKSLLLKFASPEYNKTKSSVSSEIKVSDVFSEKNMIIMRTSALESIKDDIPKIIELAEGFGDTKCYFEARVYPYKKNALIMVRDISERKKYEDMLKLKNEEFERFNSMAVDRELKMIELKKEVERLRGKTGVNVGEGGINDGR
jgi:methyl-accepting chemotaxis protein